jgi:Protein of unknown function (DUF2877)
MHATGSIEALDAGAAWFDDIDELALGRVCGVFARAAYMRFDDRLVALCRADVASGPLHLRIRGLPALAVGDQVVFDRRCLAGDSFQVEVHPDLRWTPPPVEAWRLDRVARSGFATLSLPGLEGHLAAAYDLVAGGELVALAQLVGGRGPGLTPAGDDLLAGVLVIDAVLQPANDAMRRAAADASRTTAVAAAFLRWAARGHCIEPFHDVVWAIADRRPDREAAARVALCETGASSGAALLMGLDLALAARAVPVLAGPR